MMVSKRIARSLGYTLGFAVVLAIILSASPHVYAEETTTQHVHVSKNWAGFGVGGAFTGIRAAWVVPESTSAGKSVSADAAWVGIGGSETSDLIQVGTQTVFIKGKPQYQAWYETLPDTQRSLPVVISPGDSVTASLKETIPGLWHLSFTNITTGKSFASDIPYDSSHSSAEWIVERPLAITNKGTSYLALSDFDTLTFTNAYATVNGVEKPLEALGAEPIVMSQTASSITATPGSLANASFTLSYLNSREGRAYLKAFKKVYRNRAVLPQQGQTPMQTVTPVDGTTVIKIFF